MLGVLIYSVGSAVAAERKAEQEVAKGRTLEHSEAERLVVHALAQPSFPKA